jgi:hypothetical protein
VKCERYNETPGAYATKAKWLMATSLFNKTPLHAATLKGKLDICQLLLSYGANPNAKCGPYNKTSLHFAAEEGAENICQLLLRNKADPNVKSTLFNKTALHFAAEKGNLDICQLLLNNGADLNAICDIEYTQNQKKIFKSRTALIIALKNRSFKEYFAIAQCFFENETVYHSKLPIDVKEEYQKIIKHLVGNSNTPGLPPKKKWFWKLWKLAFNDADWSLQSMCRYLVMEHLYCTDTVDEVKRMNIPETLKQYLIYLYLP